MQIFKDTGFTSLSGITEHTLFSIGDAADATGGLWLYYDVGDGKLSLVVTNSFTAINSGTAVKSTQTTMFADNTWQFIGLRKKALHIQYMSMVSLLSLHLLQELILLIKIF